MGRLTQSPAWRALAERYAAHAGITLVELFAADPGRGARFTRELGGITVDASKTHLTPTILDSLLELAAQEDVAGWRDRMLAGERINHTEGRAALHAALRTPELGRVEVDGVRIDTAVAEARERMRALVTAVHDGTLRTAQDQPFTDVVNIGIGGSDLGPRLACEALAPYRRETPRVHFVANVDPADRETALAAVDPARTLFVVASKTFTTMETLANARALFDALAARFGRDGARAHFVAVTGAPGRARQWGIDAERILPLWDWVGGRYSLWSPIGLPVALALGMERFEALLDGAAEVDRHFRDSPGGDNLPLLLALIDVWYGNFAGARSRVVVPYSQRLASLPAYLQQLEMESNGKSVDRDGEPVDYATAPAVWGQVGTTGQHAFFQWLHQGTQVVPCDVVVVRAPGDADRDALAANAIGQAAALLEGRGSEALRRAGVDEALRPHRAMPGDHPSVTWLLDGLTPRTLGALLALHEHRVFCQAMIWRINPFDQWGVERGKELARALVPMLGGEGDSGDWDQSTRALVARYRGSG